MKERTASVKMTEKDLPSCLSYIILSHAGSIKPLRRLIEKNLPEIRVIREKKVATHYYILHLELIANIEHAVEEIYKLPVMAVREEFTSTVLFKKVKTYNNALHMMYKKQTTLEKEYEENAPFLFITELLTPMEKYFLFNPTEDVKQISLKYEQIIGEEKPVQVTHEYQAESFKTAEFLDKLFEVDDAIVDGDFIEVVPRIKEANWKIGIL